MCWLGVSLSPSAVATMTMHDGFKVSVSDIEPGNLAAVQRVNVKVSIGLRESF